jgi:hypothetical protein
MRRLFLAFAALLVAGTWQPAGAAAKVSDAEQVIHLLYEQYGADDSPTNPYDDFFSPSLLKLWDQVDDGAGDDDEYAIDFDVFLDAQDTDVVTGLSTAMTPNGNNGATVAATFTAFGEVKQITYTMVKTGVGWKIDNISWGSDRPDLRALLADLLKKQQANK